MKNRALYILTPAIVMMVLFQACSTVKHLPDGELLYIGTRNIEFKKIKDRGEDWKINDFGKKTKSAYTAIWATPNGALFGMPYMRFLPMRSYFYNWFYTEKEKGFSRWMMENFGEPPVTISSVNPDIRVKYLENQLFNMGHFGTEASYDLKYKGKKKAVLRYSIYLTKAYTYRNIEIKLDSIQEVLRPSLNNYMKHSKIIQGNDFNLDDIDSEKELLWEHLQNSGYYYIKKNHISILADTTVGNRQVDIQYQIEKDPTGSNFREVFTANKHLSIDDKQVSIDEKKILSGKDIRYDKRLFDRIIEIEDDSLYSLENTKRTIRNISGVGIFKEQSVKYSVSETDSSSVVANIDLKTADMFSVGLSSNITQKSTGFIGPGLGAFATQHNLFGGGENLNLKVDGYFDFPYGKYSNNVSRSYGFSTIATLQSPVLKSFLPFLTKSAVIMPQKHTSFGFELNNRPDYFNIIEWKGSYGVSWSTSPRISHELNLVNINYSNILSTTADFDSLYNESTQLRNSIKDQFILGTSYVFTYNNTASEFRRFKSYFQTELELSGNLLNAAYRLSGRTGQDKEFLGVDFSQFVRIRTDFRAYLNVGDRGSQIAFRNQLGVAFAYGNSTAMPYVRQFYVGGNNSLRPVAARLLGPGTYFEFDADAINQVGDFKFDNNIEYRFRIAYILYGAFWGDFGNIWLWKEDPERPGTGLKLNRIMRDSYLTSGAGLRLDLEFVVVRADYGAILYAPIFIDGYKWLWQNKTHLWGLTLGVGYPF